MDGDNLSTATTALFVAQALIVGLLGFFSWGFVRRMRRDHAATWREIGAPGLASFSVVTSRRLAEFIRSREFERLRDPELNRWATRLRAFERVSALGFAALVLSILLRAAVSS